MDGVSEPFLWSSPDVSIRDWRAGVWVCVSQASGMDGVSSSLVVEVMRSTFVHQYKVTGGEWLPRMLEVRWWWCGSRWVRRNDPFGQALEDPVAAVHQGAF